MNGAVAGIQDVQRSLSLHVKGKKRWHGKEEEPLSFYGTWQELMTAGSIHDWSAVTCYHVPRRHCLRITLSACLPAHSPPAFEPAKR